MRGAYRNGGEWKGPHMTESVERAAQLGTEHLRQWEAGLPDGTIVDICVAHTLEEFQVGDVVTGKTKRGWLVARVRWNAS